MARYRDLTDYPDIYWRTYWGSFNASEFPENQNYILDNRNKFVKEYNLIRYRGSLPQYVYKHSDVVKHTFPDFDDHYEYYKTQEGNYIILFSPFNLRIKNEDNFINETGFKKIYDLYSDYATTYIKLVFGRKRK